MSVITSIVQAILQSIAWIIPISESGHSAIYHDFASKADGYVAALTGVIHIGIAVGILVACLKMTVRMSKEFVSCAGDVVKRNFSYREARPARKFMLMLMLCFAPMLLWLIPIGKNGMLYEVLRRTNFNGTLLDTGIFFAVTGGLLLLALRQLTLEKNTKNMTVISAVTVGIVSLVLVPVTGLSLIGGVFSLLILMGVSKKQAVNFSLLMSVPILIVMGIIEIVTAAYKVTLVQIILALIFSVACSFVCTRVFKWLINKNTIKYVAYYDLFMGGIVAVIGIVQLIIR